MRMVLTIIVGLALLCGLHACRDGDDTDEATMRDDLPYAVPEEGDEETYLEDEPDEENLPYQQEQGLDESMIPEYSPPKEMDDEFTPQLDLDKPEVEEDVELKDDWSI